MSITCHILSVSQSRKATFNGEPVIVAAFPSYCNDSDIDRWQERAKFDPWARKWYQQFLMRYGKAEKAVERGFKPKFYCLYTPEDGCHVYEWKGLVGIRDTIMDGAVPAGMLRKKGRSWVIESAPEKN